MKSMLTLKYFFLTIFCLQISTAFSQLYQSGEDPASLRWQQINTEKFQLIFPEGYEKPAQYFANALEQAYELVPQSLKKEPRKISVLFHNQSVISNGIAPWAPARIEVYNTPPQNTYAVNWFSQLAIHELRHVVQIEKMNSGLTKVLGILFGQQAAAAILGTYLPWWFIEGDAVVIETALSHSGRGRLPSFEMPLKAQLLEKGIYSYEKATHASYKDFTPNSYELGYQIVAYGRSKYGSELWEKSLDYVAQNPLSITPFSSSIKKTTGFSKREFYTNSMEFLKEKWTKQLAALKVSDYQILTKTSEHFRSYENPVFLADASIIAFKTSMDEVNQIVSIDQSGNEEIVLSIGSSYRDALSLGGNILCWAEIETDARWSHRSYSVIKLFNIETNTLADLTRKSRFFAPQLNKQGTKVAAIEVSSENVYSLVILDVLNGNEIARYESQDGAFLMHPTWSVDDTEIVMTTLNEKGKNIRILNLENGQTNDILDFSFAEIKRPQLVDNRVFFIASYSGIDNLYAFDRSTQKIKQITSVKFGIDNYVFNNTQDQIVFSNYSSDGFGLAKQNIDPSKEISLTNIQPEAVNFADDMAAQEQGIVEINEEDMQRYEVKKYPKTSGLFNFHSWYPFSMDLVDYETKPGVTLMSQNILGTAISSLGYEYDLNEKVGKYYANFEYRGWYPVIDLNVEYRKERGVYKYIDSLHLQHEIPFSYHELETSIGISQPLNFSKNKFISGITPFVRLKNTSRKIDDGFDIEFTESNFQSVEYGLSVYHYLRSSLKDLYPKWGVVGRLRYIHTPFTSLTKSDMLSMELITYIPGFMKHHGFKLYGGAQLRTVGSYNPSNVVPFIRGMSRPALHEYLRLSVDYKFPLFYPDWDLNSLMYVKRITMNLFYDYALGSTPNYIEHYESIGSEIQAQVHFLSFLAPVNVGFRAVYLPSLSDYELSAFISIDFSALY